VDVKAAARRWATTWEREWPVKDVEAITALYAEDAAYRALAFREPDRGLEGVRGYLQRNFELEDAVDCSFGEPLAAADRAVVEWWASWREAGSDVTLAGVTILRFDHDGRVVDHRDYWNQIDERRTPFPDW
jgi:hypothetical protein